MDKKKIFMLPGEIAVTRVPAIIVTLLGSCVAVCLYNTKEKFGGMNHFMLPTGENRESMGKYGDFATKKLIESMLKVDPDPTNIVARIFGGGAVIEHLDKGVDIADKNVEMAERILRQYDIRIIERNTKGGAGRKIYFDNYEGTAKLEVIKKSADEGKDKKIKVLIVDDSSTVRGILRRALEQDDEIVIVGEAEDAFDARDKILEFDPDVLTLDIIMPKLDGVSFLKKLMVHYPKPTVIVSSVAQKGSKMRLRAQQIGAVDVVDKEELKLYQGLDTVTKVLTQKIKAAAKIDVEKRDEKDVSHI